MDDMVVKSASCEKHHQDLSEVFATLRKDNLRLDLDKCDLGWKEESSSASSLPTKGLKSSQTNVEL